MERLAAALADQATRQPIFDRRWSYYRGTQPRVWVNDKMRRIFRDLADSFGDNYCATAVDARLARMNLTGWTGQHAEEAELLWTQLRWPERFHDFARWALAYADAAIICTTTDTGGKAFDPVKPVGLRMWVKDDDPVATTAAVRVWHDAADNIWRASEWDEATITRYTAPCGPKPGVVPKKEQWTMLDEPAPHGFTSCPVVPVSLFGDGQPLMDRLRGPQDRINKIAANKFVAAEFGAFRQRVLFTRQQVESEDLEQRPDHALVLDPGEQDAPARIQEMSATDLANYDRARDAEIDSLFTLAPLPRHMRVNPGAAPSGEAVRADEGPFTEAVAADLRAFGAAFTRAMLLLELDATPTFASPQVTTPQMEMAAVKAATDAGIPWQVAVKRYAGWDDDDVLAAEQSASVNTAGAGAALLQAFASAPVTDANPATP